MKNDRFDPARIKKFWDEQAREHGQAPAASWSDVSVIELEIRELASRLRDGDRVLDIGCANGYSTMSLASAKAVQARGLDYIPEMIRQAKRRLASAPAELRRRVSFEVGDARRLKLESGAFDVVILTRVLINLHDWPTQRKALGEAARMLRPGGRLLLSEATIQGWKKLNEFRGEWGLPPIGMPSFNAYLDQDKVVKAAKTHGLRLVELCDFASTYYVATRVFKPLLARASGGVDAADPLMHFNQFFSKAPAWGDYGTQKLFHFEKV